MHLSLLFPDQYTVTGGFLAVALRIIRGKKYLNVQQFKFLFSSSSRYSLTYQHLVWLNKLCNTGSAKCIFKCVSRRYQMKNIFLLNTGLLVLHPKDCCIVLRHQAMLIMIFILLMSFIYLIPCCRSSLEYVGEVGKKINKRFNWHKSQP